MKNFIKSLFESPENEEIQRLKKELEELKTLKQEVPLEMIRRMTKEESNLSGYVQKYLGIENMSVWADFYIRQKEVIKFIKFMRNIDGVDIFTLLENVGNEIELLDINRKMETEEGRRDERERIRKNLQS